MKKPINKGENVNELFAPESQQAIKYAQDEALRLHHGYIGTEHLLLGILRLGICKAITILENAGVPPDALHQSIEKVVQPNTASKKAKDEQIPLTARAKQVLEKSAREARALKAKNIETEHLLLALAKDEHGVAAQVLGMFDFDYRDAYEGVLLLDSPSPEAIARGRVEMQISEALRDTIQRAQGVALNYGSSKVIICHFLYALIQREADPALDVLVRAGVDLNALKADLETFLMLDEKTYLRVDFEKCIMIIRRPLTAPERVALSDAAKKVLIMAGEEAFLRHKDVVDTVCLLLALLRNSTTVPATILARQNVYYPAIQKLVGQQR